MKIKMLVAAHKQYRMPKDSDTYVPVYVGAALHHSVPERYYADNIGENISAKNPHYNELTAIYWGWKNLDCDAIGLVHYRRYFKGSKDSSSDRFNQIMSKTDIEKQLREHSILLPRKRHYYIETIESHFLHSHQSVGLDALRTVLADYPGAYKAAFEQVMSARSAHMFNMFIMKKDEFDQFAEWLFQVLSKVEAKIDFDSLDGNEKRVMGFVSEFLMDTWIIANQKAYGELPVLFIEKEHVMRKAFVMIANKFNGGSRIINTHIQK